jgi:large subunit ribosomal protein L21
MRYLPEGFGKPIFLLTFFPDHLISTDFYDTHFSGGIRMYAVVNTGGKQYKVQKGETLRIEKIPGDVGSQVTFDKVLMVADGETIRVGQPLLEKAAVQASIVEQDKAKKIIVFKYKRRKRYRRKQGHRQPYTAIRIDGIEA